MDARGIDNLCYVCVRTRRSNPSQLICTVAEKGHPILPFYAHIHPSILLFCYPSMLPYFHPSISVTCCLLRMSTTAFFTITRSSVLVALCMNTTVAPPRTLPGVCRDDLIKWYFLKDTRSVSLLRPQDKSVSSCNIAGHAA